MPGGPGILVVGLLPETAPSTDGTFQGSTHPVPLSLGEHVLAEGVVHVVLIVLERIGVAHLRLFSTGAELPSLGDRGVRHAIIAAGLCDRSIPPDMLEVEPVADLMGERARTTGTAGADVTTICVQHHYSVDQGTVHILHIGGEHGISGHAEISDRANAVGHPDVEVVVAEPGVELGVVLGQGGPLRGDAVNTVGAIAEGVFGG